MRDLLSATARRDAKKGRLGGDPVRVYRGMTAWSEANRAMRDERVPIHVEGEFYDLEGFIRGGSSNLPFEVDELGDERRRWWRRAASSTSASSTPSRTASPTWA